MQTLEGGETVEHAHEAPTLAMAVHPASHRPSRR